jgi:nucleoside-diphosphate-sugar epimerase
MNLVTGATGILGGHVLLWLMQQGKPVVAGRQKSSDISKIKKLFACYNSEHLFEKINWKEVDVRDPFSIEEALEEVQHVYHCAGFVSFNSRDRDKLFAINEGGTFNVVNACLQKKITALCHASSIASINNTDYAATLDENVFWKRNGRESGYALSKYNAEREVWRGIEEGLNAVIVNPGVILSPGFWDQSSSKLFKRCYEGNSFYTGGMAGYISARDTAAIMIELTEKRHYANRYILIEGNYSFRDILNMISEGLGKSRPSIEAGKFLLNTGRMLDFLRSKITGKEQVLTGAIIDSAFNKQLYSNQKIRDTLGWQFTPVSSEIKSICVQIRKELEKSA